MILPLGLPRKKERGPAWLPLPLLRAGTRRLVRNLGVLPQGQSPSAKSTNLFPISLT